jgi:dTDP-4-dehydrorhamnose reductase
MLAKVEKGANLNITTEQKGSPTNANDLASAILKIVTQEKKAYGIYHFSNTDSTTWYGFAFEIFKNANALDQVKLSPIDSYPTKAKRPNFSVMNTQKLQQTFNIEIKDWKTSLKDLQLSIE